MQKKHFIYPICLVLGLFCFHFTLAQPIQIQWQKSLGGGGRDDAYAIEEIENSDASNDRYIVFGTSDSDPWQGDLTAKNAGADYWVAKLGASANLNWQKAFGGSNNEEGFAMCQTTDGGVVLAGSSQSNNGDVTGHHGAAGISDFWIVRLDVNGNMIWEKSLGGSNNDVAYAIQQTIDGGYIIAGYTQSNDGEVTGFHGQIDYWVVKLDVNGNMIWQKSLGGSKEEVARSIQQTADGGYIVAGYATSKDGDVTGGHASFDNPDYWVVKLDANGNIVWEKTLGGNADDIAIHIRQTTDGGYIVVGQTRSVNGDVTGHIGALDFWVVKLNTMGAITWQKCLGSSSNDIAVSVRQTTDGGYIVAGESQGGAGNDGDVTDNHGWDCWVTKLDVNGNLMWQKCLGGSDGMEHSASIIQTKDEGYVLAGSSWSTNGDATLNHGLSDYWVVKLGFTTAIEPPNLNNFSVFPNPVKDIVEISCEHLSANEITKVSLVDVLGQVVFAQDTQNLPIKLNMSTQPSGLYFLYIEQNGKPLVKKLYKL